MSSFVTTTFSEGGLALNVESEVHRNNILGRDQGTVISNERLTTLVGVHYLRFAQLHLHGDHVDITLVLEQLCRGLQHLL